MSCGNITVSFISYREAAQRQDKKEEKSLSLSLSVSRKYRSNIYRAHIINYSYFGLYNILIMHHTHANCTPTKIVTMCFSHNCKYGFVNPVFRVTVPPPSPPSHPTFLPQLGVDVLQVPFEGLAS